MSEKKFEYKEPLKGERFIFTLLPLDSLEVISHQRKPSQYHVKHLLQSLRKIGFTVPIMVVEGNKKGKYVIIDGQHRFLAAKELELEKIPAIIVPKKMAKLMMNFNIEKELNIREKSYVALQVYEEILQKEPEMAENDPEIIDAIEQGYYVTLGIAYQNTEKLAGSSFESILKTKFGLTEDEAKVYSALLIFGPLTSSAISELTKVSLSKIDLIVEKLVNYGLIKKIEERPVRFIAFPPYMVIAKKTQTIVEKLISQEMLFPIITLLIKMRIKVVQF